MATNMIGTPMSKPPLIKQDYIDAAAFIGVPDYKLLQAVGIVESKGSGFDPEDFPKTLFEAHIFHRNTGGEYDSSYPSLSGPKWDRSKYGKDWKEEKARLALAITLNRVAALESASWGEFQIMGFNYESCGCVTVQEFVNAMCLSSKSQLLLFCKYIQNNNLIRYLRAHDWRNFASRYNGPDYAVNKYDTKLGDAYARLSSNP